MPYRFTADLVVVVHFTVVLFVVFGAALVIWRRWIAWVHLPIVAWVVFAECFGKICPLTYLEDWLRDQGRMERYRGDFVAHYIMPVLYPEGLTPRIQVVLGVLVFVINLTLYVIAFRRKRSASAQPASAAPPEIL